MLGKPNRRSGMPTRRSEKAGETHPMVRERSGKPPEGPGKIGRPTRSSGKGRETHPEVQEGSGHQP